MVVGVALGKLVHVLDGKTVCVAVGAALGKLVDVLDGDTVCVAVVAALGKLVDVLDGDTVCVEVGWSGAGPAGSRTRRRHGLPASR
jgi:hypothetical protein